ncbi:ferritin-like domain-containing protein [Fictibacillus sp. NRS-1165]|uniref:ferritin-like domain-containing protein n=1 Tax=Fictibacillus sp. NRS-1165 TaxID=3144463 RepID=UPI003D1CC4DE
MYANSYNYDRQQQDANLINDISQAINGQYSAIACYQHLAQIAPSEKERDRILEIRQDEINHYHVFSAIYTQLTGRQPTPQITEQCPNDYIKGLEVAIEDEQKTVDFYLEIADKAQTPYIREQFRRAAWDEQNHAVWFLYFYTKRH